MGSDDVDGALNDGQHDGRNGGFDEWVLGHVHLWPAVTGGGPDQSRRRVTSRRQCERWRPTVMKTVMRLALVGLLASAVFGMGTVGKPVPRPKVQTAKIKIT